MNKFSLILLILLAAITSPVLAVPAEQKISAVTVYPDRALVTRTGTVKLDASVQSIVFDNLPLNLEEDSVRAKAQGKLKILGVEVRRDYKEVAVSTATRQLQDDVTKLDDQIEALTDEQNNLQRRTDFLDQIRNKVTSQASSGEGREQVSTVPTMQGFFQLYSTERSKITLRWREIDHSVRDLNKLRADKANQLSLLQQPAAPNTRSAVVTVEAAESGPVDLQVSYLIPGAGWQPQYDAYADPDTQKVELTYYGVVRQTTGENWDDVALTLSSARPGTAARLPELAAWTIDFAGIGNGVMMLGGSGATLKDASRALTIANNGLTVNAGAQVIAGQVTAGNTSVNISGGTLVGTSSLVMSGSGAPPAPADADLQVAEIRSLGPAATFVVPAKASIPSDNQPHRSAISVQTLKGEWTYVATPKLVPSAFLKTRVTNTSGGPLLGGDINAFLGNNFIGKSYIGLVAANATFDLFLGTDENIKVTRTEGVKKEEIGGILSKMRLYKRSFTIELQNFKSTDASFKLRDQLPVSKNGKIEVKVTRAEPAITSRDEETGEVTWEFKLKPNAKQKLTVDYEVDAPYDLPVAGI
jgi:chaperonin cofactor prefoldin